MFRDGSCSENVVVISVGVTAVVVVVDDDDDGGDGDVATDAGIGDDEGGVEFCKTPLVTQHTVPSMARSEFCNFWVFANKSLNSSGCIVNVSDERT